MSSSGISGATVIKGIAGFGHAHRLHSANILDISDNLPVKIEFIETRDKVDEILGELEMRAGSGLIEVQENPTSGPGSPSGNGAATYTTTYTYDVLDDLTGVTQPGLSNSACSNGQSRCFTYDSLKRLVQANNPESGSITYQYDSSGNLSKRIDPVRTVSFAAYDGLNRINGKSYSDTNPNTPAVTYTYCDTTGTCASSCNGLGRLSSVSTNAASGTTSNGMSWSAPAITDTYS